MSDFTEFVSTPTVVEAFYWHTYKKKNTVKDQFQPTKIWLRVLVLQFTQTQLPSKGNFTWMSSARLSWTFRYLIWVHLTWFQMFPHSWILHTTFILCHKYCHQINHSMLYIGQLEKDCHYTCHNVVWRVEAKKTQQEIRLIIYLLEFFSFFFYSVIRRSFNLRAK